MNNLSVEDNFYVYVLRRPDRTDPCDPNMSCPFYVGKGRNGRILGHRYEASRLKNHPGRKSLRIKIIHFLWKNGLDFKEEIILNNLSEKAAFEKEIELISYYGRIDLKTGILANFTAGGGIGSPCIFSEEVRKKISDSKKGSNNPNYGKGHESHWFSRKHSEETKKKIGEKSKGRPAWNKGIPMTEEQKLRINFAKRSPNYHPSEESNRKRSETLKIKYNTEEYKQKLSETMKRVWAIRRGEILND